MVMCVQNTQFVSLFTVVYFIVFILSLAMHIFIYCQSEEIELSFMAYMFKLISDFSFDRY